MSVLSSAISTRAGGVAARQPGAPRRRESAPSRRPQRRRRRCRRASSAGPPARTVRRAPEAAAGACRRRDGVGGQVRGAEGQADRERGARAFGALCGDGAAVQADQFLAPAPARCRCPRWSARGRVSMRWNRSNSRGISAAGTPIPVSATVTTASPSSRRTATEMDPSKVNFSALRQQVEDHLLPHVAVDVDRFVQRGAVDVELQPGPVDGRPEDAGQLGGDGREVDRLVAGLRAAGLDAGEVQQRVDQLGEPQSVAPDDVQLSRASRRPARWTGRAARRRGRGSASAGCGTRG